MDLILWRHAQAEDAAPDLTRNLTSKGHRQAKRMAYWLRLYLPKDVRILSSPANRTWQTADALELPYEECDELAPDCSAQQYLKAAGWPKGDEVTVPANGADTVYAVIIAQNGRGKSIRIHTYNDSIAAAKLFTEKSTSGAVRDFTLPCIPRFARRACQSGH